jgi:hypothetical protein
MMVQMLALNTRHAYVPNRAVVYPKCVFRNHQRVFESAAIFTDNAGVSRNWRA